MERPRKRTVAGDGRDRPRDKTRDRPKKAPKPKPVFDRSIQAPAGLVAKNPPPLPKLKHQSYFEFVENTNKKKQLEYQVDSTDRTGKEKDSSGRQTPDLTLRLPR